MSAPAVSVVLPVYNGGALLTHALQSLSEQTFTDYEVIVVDDGSTDDTAAHAAAAANHDARVRVLHHRVNRGLLASLADGLAAANGEFVARLDADDLCLPRRLEVQVAAMREEPRLTLCWSAYERRALDSDERLGVVVPPLDHAAMQLGLTRANRILHSSVMFRLGAARAIGGYLDEWYPAEDYDLWCRLLASGLGRGVAEPLVVSRVNPHGISLSNAEIQHAVARRRAAVERERLGVADPGAAGSSRPKAVAQRRLAAAVRKDLAVRRLPDTGVAGENVRATLADLSDAQRLTRWGVVASVAPIDCARFVCSRVARAARG